jgi:hypothetical protein
MSILGAKPRGPDGPRALRECFREQRAQHRLLGRPAASDPGAVQPFLGQPVDAVVATACPIPTSSPWSNGDKVASVTLDGERVLVKTRDGNTFTTIKPEARC